LKEYGIKMNDYYNLICVASVGSLAILMSVIFVSGDPGYPGAPGKDGQKGTIFLFFDKIST
jgi:hypothetical protein